MNKSYKNSLVKSRFFRVLAMNCIAMALLAAVRVAGPSSNHGPAQQPVEQSHRTVSKLHVDWHRSDCIESCAEEAEPLI